MYYDGNYCEFTRLDGEIVTLPTYYLEMGEYLIKNGLISSFKAYNDNNVILTSSACYGEEQAE